MLKKTIYNSLATLVVCLYAVVLVSNFDWNKVTVTSKGKTDTYYCNDIKCLLTTIPPEVIDEPSYYCVAVDFDHKTDQWRYHCYMKRNK